LRTFRRVNTRKLEAQTLALTLKGRRKGEQPAKSLFWIIGK
jgi:hypothetical protein